LVPRPRLSEGLLDGDEAALTLIPAPAGFGKTTLLTECLVSESRRGAAAWLSLDPRDNDPIVFWRYLLTAVQTAAPEAGSGALALLRTPQTPMDEVLATAVNDLDAITGEFVLVLDDYHVIESRAVHDGMTFLLHHLPPRLRVVIATRADPPLPLARLRARGELIEVRADDLRFTTAEAAAYLTDGMGLRLTAGELAALEDRTEGWIAALQLAALSMHGRDDIAGFIASFAGDDRYIVDYLVEEVLQRQPDDVREFLLETSILGRLTGPLCDAVGQRTGGKAMLENLDRANLFLVPLDDRRQWYRYHHLFGDVLRARLLDERPDAVPDLHRRAATWYRDSGEPAEAVRHALAGGDAELAADLVEQAMPAWRQNRQEATLRHWLEALPAAVLRDRPLLSTTYAGVLLMFGELDGVEDRLRDAERWLEVAVGRGVSSDNGDGVAGADGDGAARAGLADHDATIRAVRSEVALYRAAQARVTGDLAGTMAHARRVLDVAGPDQHLLRGAAAGLLGLALWSGADLDAAYRWWSDSLADLERAGYQADTLGVAIALADISVAQGRLHDAMTAYTQGLARATRGVAPLRGAADMHVGMSELYCERNDLAAARRHLQASAELGEHAGLPQNRHRFRVASARLAQAEGDLAGAVELLDEAERLYVSDMFPDVRPIPAMRARVWIGQGRFDRALTWARERGLSVTDDPDFLREYEHLTLCRALLAQHAATGDDDALAGADRLLERLLPSAEHGSRAGSVLEILLLRAQSQQARGNLPAALDSLARALTMAEPQGYLRILLDSGPVTGILLRTLAKRGVAPGYIRSILAAARAASAAGAAGSGGAAGAGGADRVSPRTPGLIDPLSTRELHVLRLLGTDLDGPGIARELVVSLNTVRTHTKNIYAKLGVNSRRAAIRRAAELDLLSTAPTGG
jgi:LuxR family maltose regulon positive regulatory protein